MRIREPSCSVANNDLMLFQKSAFLKAEAVDMLIQHHLFSWDT